MFLHRRNKQLEPKGISTKEYKWLHRSRHKLLHRMLDELVADAANHLNKRLSQITVMELIEWSNSQTITPTDYLP